MVTGEEIIVGRLGQQPMIIANTSVDPQHLVLRKLDDEKYQIEDKGSAQGTYVFGIRIKRKKIKEDTPFQMGNFKTCVRELLRSQESLKPLGQVWDEYDSQKRHWTNLQTRASRIPMFVSLGAGAISSPIVAFSSSLGLSQAVAALVPIFLMAIAYIVAMKYGESVTAKRDEALNQLNADFQHDYICPRCHKFLGYTSFDVLKSNSYCPHCGAPIHD